MGDGQGVWQWDGQLVAEGAWGGGERESMGLGSLPSPPCCWLPPQMQPCPTALPNCTHHPVPTWQMTRGNNFPPEQGQIAADKMGRKPPKSEDCKFCTGERTGQTPWPGTETLGHGREQTGKRPGFDIPVR
ncbi:hypothetical protein KIL84_013052 [Mauremys mutica]|uniref:Uncharacterized protein n=1 Tax=Mauremys mutica TaxID=74926 RepID=A0A9D3XS47_9SAUR|nr:hypothetical protein KIL84_013052 [Mauremys mutica]